MINGNYICDKCGAEVNIVFRNQFVTPHQRWCKKCYYSKGRVL